MMKFLKNNFLLLCVAVSSFQSLQAADFSAADALFAERTNEDKAEESRKLYSQLLPSLKSDELAYAVEQISRLDFYRGSKLPENEESNKKRKKIFLRCLENQENISPEKFGSSIPSYYYWKGACLASWAKANGLAKSLEKSKEMLELIEIGKSVSTTYEGGGFYRLGAVVYNELPPLFGGSVEKASEYAALAEASEAYEGAINPDTETGRYFYNVYIYKAKILVKQNKTPEAKQVLEEALARISAGDISVGKEPETELYRKEIKDTLESI
jgi:hypothetical protein